VSDRPVDAEIHRLVGAHLDEDRLDEHLARRMSSRSTIDMTERMTFGGAVTTSALVCGSAQIMTLLSPAAWGADRGAERAAAPPRRRLRPRRCPDLFAQLRRDLLGVGVSQVAHLRVAAGIERCVEVRDSVFSRSRCERLTAASARCSCDRPPRA
jgi:hypothetical protein